MSCEWSCGEVNPNGCVKPRTATQTPTRKIPPPLPPPPPPSPPTHRKLDPVTEFKKMTVMLRKLDSATDYGDYSLAIDLPSATFNCRKFVQYTIEWWEDYLKNGFNKDLYLKAFQQNIAKCQPDDWKEMREVLMPQLVLKKRSAANLIELAKLRAG